MDREVTSEKDLDPGSGSATPEEQTEAAEPQREYQIDIYRDWCKSCGICAAFCPRNCLSLNADGAPVVEKAERCTGCRWCELHCPDFAICVRELTAPEGKPEEAD